MVIRETPITQADITYLEQGIGKSEPTKGATRTVFARVVFDAARAYDAQQRSQGASGEPEGFFYKGQAYIVASQMRSTADVARVLAHEVLGHAGLRGKFGQDLDGVLNQIVAARRGDVLAKAKAYGLGTSKADLQTAAEEVLANLAETQPQIGFVRRAVAAIRTWLRERGVPVRMSDDEIIRNFILPARRHIEGQVAPGADMAPALLRRNDRPETRSLADDADQQLAWLTQEAKARGFADVDTMAAEKPEVFAKLAARWRADHPAAALMSRQSIPLVSAQSQLDADIKDAGSRLQRAIDAKRADGLVKLGRAPHVLSMAIGGQMSNPLQMVIPPDLLNKTVAEPGSVKSPDAGKHFGDLKGVSGQDLARAMYRPAAVVEDTAQRGNFALVTNILTSDGPLIAHVDIGAKEFMDGRETPVVLVKSIYARKHGVLADWINGKKPERVVHYIDPVQIGEAVTGRLNPENANPAFKGRDLVSAKGAINASGHDALVTSSPISDKSIVPAFGSPANANYRGLATVQGSLEKLLTGRGLKPGMKTAKTYQHLMAWIDKQYKGDADGRTDRA